MFAALVAAFPGIHVILLDSDCLPVALFEAAVLWREATISADALASLFWSRTGEFLQRMLDVSSSQLHWTLVPMPLALLSILTPRVPMEEFTRNDLSRSPFCYSSLTFRECVPTQLSPVNASTMGLSYWITRSKSTMETMSRAGFSHVRSSLATLFAMMSRLKKNLMENLSQTTQWLLHHDHLLPSGRWRDTGSVSGELEGKVVAIVCIVSPSLGGRFSFFPSVPPLI